MTKTILVTGSSGTVGTAISKKLLSEGYTVHCIDRIENPWSDPVDKRTDIVDLTSPEGLDTLPDDVDMILHLAANARVHKLVKDPTGAKENFDMTFNVLEYARQNNVPKFIFSSSREVYGNKDKVIYSERDTYTDECESPYTASKMGGEALVKSYQQCYDIESSILRFSNVYGRYDASNRVVPLFIALAERGDDLTVYGSEKVLDFTYLDDCVTGVQRVISNFNKATGMTFNIASGTGTTLVELAQTVTNKLDSESQITIESNRTGEVGRYIADISKAEKVLGYSPSYTFEEGIEETIEWYLKNAHLFDEIIGD